MVQDWYYQWQSFLIDPNSAGGGRAAAGNHNQDNQETVSDVNYRIAELLP